MYYVVLHADSPPSHEAEGAALGEVAGACDKPNSTMSSPSLAMETRAETQENTSVFFKKMSIKSERAETFCRSEIIVLLGRLPQ